MKIMKHWPLFFLLLALTIAPLFKGIETGVLVAIHILVLVVFIKVFLSSYQEFRIPYNSLALFICLFYLWMALSISWSPSPSISLFMFVWLSLFPLCFFIYSFKQPSDWPYFSIGILCVALFFSFIGIGQGLFLLSDEIVSLFPTKNIYPAFLNLIAVPATAYFIRPKHLSYKSSITLGIILFILFFAVFQTTSKGAAISLLLGLVFILIISFKYIERSSFLKVVFIVTTAYLFAYIQTDGYTVTRLEEVFKGVQGPSISGRLLMWESAWKIIETAPVIGVGIGTYYIFEPAVRHKDLESTAGYFAHNDYLQVWLETGLIGLSLMVIIMISVCMLFMRVLKHSNLMLHDRLELTGLMGGLFAVSFHTFFDFNFHVISILMIMGFMCARIQEISGNYFPKLVRDFIPARKLSKNLFILVSGAIPVVVMSYSLPVSIADFHHHQAKEYLESGEIKNAERILNIAALWNPKSYRIRVQQFSLYRNILKMIENNALISERKVYLARALFVLNKIEDINPLAGIVPEGRGLLLIENNDIYADDWEIKAINEFNKTLQLQPRRYAARIALARLLVKQDNLDKAVTLLNDGVNYYYQRDLHGLDEFYQYAVELNLMKGNIVKVREIQVKIDDMNKWRSEQKILFESIVEN